MSARKWNWLFFGSSFGDGVEEDEDEGEDERGHLHSCKPGPDSEEMRRSSLGVSELLGRK